MNTNENRILPNDLTAEQSVLGAILLSQSALTDVVAVLEPADFYQPKHEYIYRAVLDLVKELAPVDSITVVDELQRKNQLQQAGGVAYVHELTSVVPTAANAGFYASIVKEKAVYRRMIDVAGKISAAGFNSSGDLVADLETAKQSLDEVIGLRRVEIESIGSKFQKVVSSWDEPANHIPTPWWELNQLIGGLKPGQLIVVAARPGSGKSIMALQLAEALSEHGSVAFSALEMSQEQLLERLISSRNQVNMASIARHDLQASDKALINSTRGAIERLPIYVDDRSNVTVNEVKNFARQVNSKGKIAGVIVDYLQLMSSHDKKMSAIDSIGDIARQLKILARELDCPVVVLSQLNRDSVQSKDKKSFQRPPTLADISRSDQIGHHADIVLLLQRAIGADGQTEDNLDVFVGKNRSGRTGKRTLRWEAKFARLKSRSVEQIY